VPEQFRGNGALTQISPRAVASTSAGPPDVGDSSTRSVESSAPAAAAADGPGQPQHKEQELAKSQCTAQASQRQSEGDGSGQAEALSCSNDQVGTVATISADAGPGQGLGGTLGDTGPPAGLAMASLSGSGTPAGRDAPLERHEAAAAHQSSTES
jgi:hypothetical protein